MSSESLQKSGQIVRNAVPFVSTTLFIFGSVVVLPIPYISGIAPLLGLMAVYYWSIYKPDLLRPLLVFLLGVLNDALHMLPIGLTAAVFLCVYQLVFSQRRFFVGQIFYMIWVGFVLIALISSFAQWAVLSMVEGQRLSIQPILMQFLFSIALFPLPAWILIRLQRAFLMQG